MEQVNAGPVVKDNDQGNYTPIGDEEDLELGMFDKPLQCFGCGIGWFSFLLGFAMPLMWYYATILYFGNYYRKDPRERTGLAASAIAVEREVEEAMGDLKVEFWKKVIGEGKVDR